jgi:hypothetical protein
MPHRPKKTFLGHKRYLVPVPCWILVHTSPRIGSPNKNASDLESGGGHMAPKVAIVGIVLVMALTIATAMPLDEVIPIFHPQFLLVY